MDVDVAVLGGGPGGYTAAIRAAQLGARVACIEREPELGGTCLRIGCIPTKAWAQTAFALKQAEGTFGKLGVRVDGPKFEFSVANDWKAAAVKRMTRGVAYLFKANGVEWLRGTGTFTDANTLTVDNGAEVSFKSAIIATGSFPLRPPIPGLGSGRCVDSEGLLAQTEVPGRLVILGGGVIGCEFASIFARFGSEVTVIEMLPSLIPQEDADVSGELAKQFRKRGITLHLGMQCTEVEDSGSEVTVHFGDGQTVRADLVLVATGRGPLVEGLGLERAGVEFDPRTGIATDVRRRTSVPHIYAVGDCAGYWQLAHTAFREGEVAAQNACGHPATVGNRAVPRPIFTDPEIASVGLTEAEAREQHGDDVATGTFPWIANARAVMQDETAGWVKSIHTTHGGELLGLVMIGPHVTDMVEAGVVAIDSGAAAGTVADGMAPHPTLSEAIKDAALLALGRAIDVPNRKTSRLLFIPTKGAHLRTREPRTMTLTDPRRARNARPGRMPRRTVAGADRGLTTRRRVLYVQAAQRVSREQANAKHKQLSTQERISGYTDAVFAVVITIMVLELHPPSSARIGAILGLWPTVVSYVVSYLFVAIIWINHHFLMGYVRQTTLRVIWFNFIHLFFVSLLPFATAWIAQTELASAPVVVYTTLFFVTDGAYNLLESEILRNSPDFSAAEYKATRRRSLIALALFATAVLLAVLQPAAGLSFIVLALLLHLRPDVRARAQLRLRRRGKVAR